MTAGALEHVHADIAKRGYALTTGRALGLPREADVIAALSPSLELDPRGAGKLHARDVITYDRATGAIGECDSIAHIDGTDDYSRFRLLDSADVRIRMVTAEMLILVPPALRRTSGRMSADYFRYTAGTGSAAHQDGFGDLVVIWVLDRNGSGAESFLLDLNGRDVMRGPLSPGTLLIFRDEMFLHGVTPLRSGHRDALIFITLKDGA